MTGPGGERAAEDRRPAAPPAAARPGAGSSLRLRRGRARAHPAPMPVSDGVVSRAFDVDVRGFFEGAGSRLGTGRAGPRRQRAGTRVPVRVVDRSPERSWSHSARTAATGGAVRSRAGVGPLGGASVSGHRATTGSRARRSASTVDASRSRARPYGALVRRRSCRSPSWCPGGSTSPSSSPATRSWSRCSGAWRCASCRPRWWCRCPRPAPASCRSWSTPACSPCAANADGSGKATAGATPQAAQLRRGRVLLERPPLCGRAPRARAAAGRGRAAARQNALDPVGRRAGPTGRGRRRGGQSLAGTRSRRPRDVLVERRAPRLVGERLLVSTSRRCWRASMCSCRSTSKTGSACASASATASGPPRSKAQAALPRSRSRFRSPRGARRRARRPQSRGVRRRSRGADRGLLAHA